MYFLTLAWINVEMLNLVGGFGNWVVPVLIGATNGGFNLIITGLLVFGWSVFLVFFLWVF